MANWRRQRIIIAVFITLVFVDCSLLLAKKGFRVPKTHKKVFQTLKRWQGKTFEGNDAEFIAEVFLENRRFLPKTKKVLRKKLSSGRYGPQVLPSETKLPADVHLFHLSGGRGTLLALHLSGPIFVTVNKNKKVVEVSLEEEHWKKALVSTRRIIHPEAKTPLVFVEHPKGTENIAQAATGGSPVSSAQDWLAKQPTYLIVLLAVGAALIVGVPLAVVWRWAGKEEGPAEPSVADRLGVLDAKPEAPSPQLQELAPANSIDAHAPTPPAGMAKAIAKQLAAEEAAKEAVTSGLPPIEPTLGGGGGLPPIEPSLGGGGLGSILSTPSEAQVSVDSAPASLTPAPEGETLNPESEEEVLARLRKRLKG